MLKKLRKTQSQLQSGFHCCCSSGRHPGLSAVSPREIQRARDEDEAIVLILPVRHSAPQFAFDGRGGRKPQGSVGECSEGLWLGNLFGCKLKISPCGDDSQVPLVTISMCPAASSSMVGVFQKDTPGVFSSREALMGKSGCRWGSWLGVCPHSLPAIWFLSRTQLPGAPVVTQAYATERKHNWTLPFASLD